VFAAWQSVEARERWQAPTPEVRLEYVETDFREGGRDVVRCIEADKPIWEAQAYYLHIRPDTQIVFAELVSGDSVHESAALVGVEFIAAPDGTRLVVTLQITAFNGEQMLGGYQFGWNAALDNLAKEL
jgi:uncharacterized protein YndB with AHSA1/START domain